MRVPDGVKRGKFGGNGKKGKAMGTTKWLHKERVELAELRQKIEQTTDAEEIEDLGEEVISLMERASYGAADRELRREYNLPSVDKEIEQLKTECLDLEHRIARNRSTFAVPVRPN